MSGTWIPCWACEGEPVYPDGHICEICDGICGYWQPEVWGPWCPLEQPLFGYVQVIYPDGHIFTPVVQTTRQAS